MAKSGKKKHVLQAVTDADDARKIKSADIEGHDFISALSQEWVTANKPAVGTDTVITRNEITLSGSFEYVAATQKVKPEGEDERTLKGYAVVFYPRFATLEHLTEYYKAEKHDSPETRVLFDAGRQATTDIRNVTAVDIRRELLGGSLKSAFTSALSGDTSSLMKQIASGKISAADARAMCEALLADLK